MRSSLKRRVSVRLERLARAAVAGTPFRKYAPQSPPAPPGGPLLIALVDLIPHLGDSILVMPILEAIRREHPAAEISVFAAGGAAILALHPAVDHFYLYQQPVPRKRLAVAFSIVDMVRQWRARFRHLRFDVCFVPRGGVEPFHSGHLAWLLGGKRRAGYSRRLEPELSQYDLDEDPLFTDLVSVPGGPHEVTRGVEALQLAGVLQQPVDLTEPVAGLQTLAASEGARQFLQSNPELAKPYAIIAPGASTPRRRWSPAGFAALAQTEMIDRNILPVFAGSPGERPLCEQIAAALSGPSLIVTGTTFVELVGLCAGARFFLGNDSGPGHVAGAVGIPTLEATAFAGSGDPYHHASPARSHPCGPFVTVVQPATQIAPCTSECVAEVEHCIAQITPEEMRIALDSLLARRQIALSHLAQFSGSNIF